MLAKTMNEGEFESWTAPLAHWLLRHVPAR
jgi:hypothetical protein